MLRNSWIILPIPALLSLNIILICQSAGWSDDSSGSFLYYNRQPPSSLATNPSRQGALSFRRQNVTPSKGLTDSPAYHEENIFGYPIRQDPMFDKNPRPSWAPMIENKPLYDRPNYNPPDYDAPIVREDPIRKPVYEKPLYELPIDDKPKYEKQYDQAPAYMKPNFEKPVYERPNYVIKAYTAPAYDNKPAYDYGSVHYDRPEYNAPVYNPQEYRPPRELPPPYIAPPK